MTWLQKFPNFKAEIHRRNSSFRNKTQVYTIYLKHRVNITFFCGNFSSFGTWKHFTILPFSEDVLDPLFVAPFALSMKFLFVCIPLSSPWISDGNALSGFWFPVVITTNAIRLKNFVPSSKFFYQLRENQLIFIQIFNIFNIHPLKTTKI